ncbi:MAG: Rrf2 family transcriptional regulator [Candidatus Kapabacteria bacterium]|nr:Rrf2 family transcriptional regulator [Candidatus Kapabacteria bacterium]
MTRSHHSALLTKSTRYAIQACAYLAVHANGDLYRPISEIATALSIPFHFLKKVMAELAQQGIIASQRSARGGVALAKDPRQIALLDIMAAIDGDDIFKECLLGLPGCGEEKPCPMHTAWSTERNRLKLMFSSTTLADIATRIQIKGSRIA